ncbi:MAG: DUF4097 family beta strand repeat-containing protein [Acidobacteriota bacterium]
MRKVFILIFSIFPLFVYPEVKQEIKKSFDYPEISRMRLSNVNGEISIQSWEKNKIEVLAVKKTKWNHEALERVEVVMEVDGDLLKIKTEYRKKFLFLDGDRAWVDYSVKVPQKFDLKSIKNVNGEIHLENLQGDIETATVNGRISIVNCGGSLKANTVNGSIDASLNYIKNYVDINTVNGSIDLSIPLNIDGELEVNTINGKISSDLSITLKDFYFHSRKLRATLGDGGIPIKLSTINGSITISELKDRSRI